MNYQISRNGQMYGPYTLDDLQRYLASGNVLPTDLAKSEAMADWVPVSQLLAGTSSGAQPMADAGSGYTAGSMGSGSTAPASQSSGYAGADFGGPTYGAPQGNALAVSPYPDAPNLHWGLVLLFGILTCTLFMWIWNLVIAAWLKRVQPNATSLFYYAGATALGVVQFMVGVPYGLHHALTPGLHTHMGNPIGSLIGIAIWVVRLIARYSQRASLEEHFNGPEPVGLRLDAVMTFFFGGVYFQYKLNEINAMKQAARYGAGRQF